MTAARREKVILEDGTLCPGLGTLCHHSSAWAHQLPTAPHPPFPQTSAGHSAGEGLREQLCRENTSEHVLEFEPLIFTEIPPDPGVMNCKGSRNCPLPVLMEPPVHRDAGLFMEALGAVAQSSGFTLNFTESCKEFSAGRDVT